MADKNPYRYPDDVDADLFEGTEEETKQRSGAHHTFDGTICPTCARVHDVGNMPEQLRGALQELLADAPGNIAAEVLMHIEDGEKDFATNMLHGFQHFSNNIVNTAKGLPALRALLETLDELTDGKASARWRIYELERETIALHLSLKSANNVLEEGREWLASAQREDEDADITKVAKFVDALEFICEMMVDRISYVNAKYAEACQEIGIEPRNDVMGQGMYESLEETDEVTKRMLEMLILAAQHE